MSYSVTPNLEPAGTDSVHGADEAGRNKSRDAEGYTGHFIEKRSEASTVSSIRAQRYQELARKRLLQVTPCDPKVIDERRAKPSSQCPTV